MKYSLLAAMLTLLLTIAGCASLSKQECQQADWYLIGVEDGARGYDIEHIGRHREACARVEVVPDIERYRAGLAEGHSRYCTEQKGYAVGASGGQHQNVCTGEMAAVFNTAYSHGREYYRLKQAVTDLEGQLEDYHQSLEALAEEAAYHEEQLLHHARTSEQRRSHLQDIRDIERRIGEIHEALVYAEREHTIAVEDFRDLHSEHLQRGYNP